MVDRYTKITLTVIAVLLAGQLMRPLLEARVVNAQPTACGTAATPCHVNIVGGPPLDGPWQGAPLYVFDPQAEARAQRQPPCGTPETPCFAMIVGGPPSATTWQGVPLLILDQQRIVPRGRYVRDP